MRKKYLLLVILTAVSGVIGGAVSNWLLTALPVYAQAKEQNERVIKVEGIQYIHLHDRDSDNCASIHGGSINIRDKYGNSTVNLGMSEYGGRVDVFGRVDDKN